MAQESERRIATDSLAHLTRGHSEGRDIPEGEVHPPVLHLDELPDRSTITAVRAMPAPLHMQHRGF